MTGMQLLASRLVEKYGMTGKAAEQALKGSTIQRVLEILAEESGIVERIALDSLRIREKAVEEKARDAESERTKAAYLYSKAQDKQMQAQRALDELEAIFNELRNYETAEARDRVRLLQLFKDSVDVKSPQNNTAFIAGCASILSGKPAWPDVTKAKEE